MRGSFNGWAGNAQELELSGDIYVGTFEVAEGAIKYQFVNARPGGDVWESVNNRTATIAGTTQTLNVVYFNDITSSASADVQVNFRVNMTVQDLSRHL